MSRNDKLALATKIVVGVLVLAWMTSSITRAAEGSPHTPITPIRHLIVIVGENHSFDNLFGAYQPVGGQTVSNLLSEGIINADGTPGPHFSKAQQWHASDTDKYSIAPQRTRPFAILPQPNSTFALGRKPNEPDSRFPADLPDGPFQLSHYAAYQLSFTGDPVHRFFQMWQQFDDGRSDLFAWVATTIGMGSEGKPPPVPFTDQSTHQGGVAMGFYNMTQGDAPVFKFIADHYAMSDNFHQGIMGGTGASFIYLGTGDLAFYSDGNGNPATPPARLIEDPDPWAGSNNWYRQDGYESGSYVNCADMSQPGVAQIVTYLRAQRAALPVRPRPLLSRQQLRARIQRRRNSGRCEAASIHLAAADSAEHRRGAEQSGRVVEVLHWRAQTRRRSALGRERHLVFDLQSVAVQQKHHDHCVAQQDCRCFGILPRRRKTAVCPKSRSCGRTSRIRGIRLTLPCLPTSISS